MRKLSDIVQPISLREICEIVEALQSEIEDTEVLPAPDAEGEKEFVKLHKTEKHADRAGNKANVRNGGGIKEAPYKKAPKDNGFPKLEEAEEIDEVKAPTKHLKYVYTDDELKKATTDDRMPADKIFTNKGIGPLRLKSSTPKDDRSPTSPSFKALVKNAVDRRAALVKKLKLNDEVEEIDEKWEYNKPIRSPVKGHKTDAKGNIILHKKDAKKIQHGKPSRKLWGRAYEPVKEDAESIDEGEAKDRPFAKLAAQVAFGKQGAAALQAGRCPSCKGEAKEFKDELSKKEHSISGMCQKCQDKTFREENLDEGKYTYKTDGPKPKDTNPKWVKRLYKDTENPKKKKEATMLVYPKGYKGGGKVSRIPKSEYDPKKHSLAEGKIMNAVISSLEKREKDRMAGVKDSRERSMAYAKKHKLPMTKDAIAKRGYKYSPYED